MKKTKLKHIGLLLVFVFSASFVYSQSQWKKLTMDDELFSKSNVMDDLHIDHLTIDDLTLTIEEIEISDNYTITTGMVYNQTKSRLYKDITYKIIYYDDYKKKNLFYIDEYTYYAEIKPGKSEGFELYTKKIDKAVKYDVKIISAYSKRRRILGIF